MDINITNPVTKEKIGEVVNGAASATPNDTDLVMSVDTSVAKKNTWTQIKAFLKNYFDTIYQAVLVSGTNIKTVNGNSLLGSGDVTVSSSDYMIVPFFPQVRFTPTSGLTYYYGANPNATIQTTNGLADWIAPCDVVIEAVYWVTTQGAGGSQLVQLDLVTNTSTVTSIGTTTLDALRVTGGNDALSVSVTKGQPVTIRATMPTFSPSPTNHSGVFSVLMRKV